MGEIESKSFQKIKALQQKAKGQEMVMLPRQNDFRNFFLSEETEKVYRELEEVTELLS